MTRISLELNATLNKKLKQYARDHYESPYGKQEDILRDALVEFLNAHGTVQPQAEGVKKNLLSGLPYPMGSSPEPSSSLSVAAEPKAKRVKKPPKSGAKGDKLTAEDESIQRK